MYTVVIDDIADKELEDIQDYIFYNLCEPVIALKIIRKIRKEIFTLPEYHNYPVVGTKGFKEVRKMRVGKHYVFFTVVEETKTIHVLHVIHTLRNWQDIV